MPNLDYITPSHVARVAGISANRARAYLQDVDPREAPRLHQRYPPARELELVAICKSKQQRKCRNCHNSTLIENEGALALSEEGTR